MLSPGDLGSAGLLERSTNSAPAGARSYSGVDRPLLATVRTLRSYPFGHRQHAAITTGLGRTRRLILLLRRAPAPYSVVRTLHDRADGLDLIAIPPRSLHPAEPPPRSGIRPPHQEANRRVHLAPRTADPMFTTVPGVSSAEYPRTAAGAGAAPGRYRIRTGECSGGPARRWPRWHGP